MGSVRRAGVCSMGFNTAMHRMEDDPMGCCALDAAA